MLLPVIGSAIIGGLIGYSTNWLAIRMLFHPLEEKRIGDHRVPFTPGLIPKQRAALAKSLGDTVADYLVTPETLTTALAHPAFEQNLQDSLQAAWQGWLTDSRTLQEMLTDHELQTAADAAVERLISAILTLPQNEKFMQGLLTAGTEVFGAGWKQLLTPAMGQPGGTLSEMISHILQDEQIHTWLTDVIVQQCDRLQEQNKTWGEILPPELQAAIHDAILIHSPEWLDWLQDQLQTPHSKALIGSLVQEFVSSHTMLRLLTIFADTDRLTASLIQSLSKEEIRTRLSLFLLRSWERILQTPASSWAACCQVNEISARLPDLLSWLGQEERLAAIITSLADSWSGVSTAQTGRQQLQKWGEDTLQQILLAPSVQQTLADLMRQGYRHCLQTQPATWLASLSLEKFDWTIKVQALLQHWVAENGPQLLAMLRLPEVVEQQVNALDIREVEEILLQVMREQLRAITNLGFVLGALIGALLPAINQWLASLA